MVTFSTKKRPEGGRNKKGQKLFLICPFCHMEHPISAQFGDVFFLTAPAAIFHLDRAFIDTLKDFIEREQVTDLYLAVESSCNLLQESMENKLPADHQWIGTLRMLRSISKDKSTLIQNILSHQAAILKEELSNGLSKQVSIHTLQIENKKMQALQAVHL